MKKVYLTLAALIIAATSFGQVLGPLPTMNPQKMRIVETPIVKKQNPSKLDGQWEYSYTEYMRYAARSNEQGLIFPVYCDSNILYNYDDGAATMSRLGIAHLFNFLDPMWYDGMLVEKEFDENIIAPVLMEDSRYSIDSVHVIYSYQRYSTAKVADTVILSVVSGYICDTSNKLPNYNLTYDRYTLVSTGGPALSHPYVGYDLEKFIPANYYRDASSISISALPATRIEVIKFPIDSTYTTEETATGVRVGKLSLPISASFTNQPASHRVLVSCTFKSGTPTTIADTIGKNANRFSVSSYTDPRSGYAQFGSRELMEALNSTLVVSPSTFRNSTTGVNWFHMYLPPLFVSSVDSRDLHLRPDFSLTLTCTNCSAVSIKNMETKNITVNPNPATDNFTVDLGEGGQSLVEMFNMVGQKVYTKATADTFLTVNTSALNSGVYMLKVNQNGKIYTSKVVVK